MGIVRAKILREKIVESLEKGKIYLDPNLNLILFSKHIGTSPRYLSKLLQEIFGVGYVDAVNSYRVREAKRLMASQNLSVTDVAYECGFSSLSTFYRAFHKYSDSDKALSFAQYDIECK